MGVEVKVGVAFNDPHVPCCGRDAADCDCGGDDMLQCDSCGAMVCEDDLFPSRDVEIRGTLMAVPSTCVMCPPPVFR